MASSSTPSWGYCSNENMDGNDSFIIRSQEFQRMTTLRFGTFPPQGVIKDPHLNSPPEIKAVTSDEVRLIVQEVVQKELDMMAQKFSNMIVTIINRELEPIKSEIRDLKESFNFHTTEFDRLQSEHVELTNNYKNVKKENDILNKTVGDLSQRLNYLEQQARSNNLEIQCLPENKQENLFTVVKQLGSVVGCEIKDSDIMNCTRTAKLQTSNDRPRSVVVQLVSPKIRDLLLASVIKYNKRTPESKLSTADLGLAGSKSPVYVVEHLSPAHKALHAATRLRAKEKGYKFVWIRNGRIFVRKNIDSDHILIKNLEAINKILITSVRDFNKTHPNDDRLNTKCIGLPGDRRPVYVAEYLPATSRKLFYEAREFAKQKGYKFCWTANGNIFLRKTEGVKQVLVKSVETLRNLQLDINQ
uniref:SFRICE_025839 n=1 Tax=Spodoptera frugiperda TaxID=7108 RepID=A0A2H1W117_SPOFR